MKALYSAILMMAIVTAVYSQPLEIRFSGGLGFQYGGNLLSSYDVDVVSNWENYHISKTNTKDQYFTAGQGKRFDVIATLHLNDRLAAFLGSGYSSGSADAQVNYRSRYVYEEWQNSYEYLDKNIIDFSYIPLVTGIQFRHTMGAITPYAGVGAGFFFPSGFRQAFQSESSYDSRWFDYWDQKWVNEKSTDTYEQSYRISTNKPIGGIGFVGVSTKLFAGVSLFAETRATLVSFMIQKAELTKYTINGRNELYALSKSEKVIVFEKNKNETYNGDYNGNAPSFGGPPIPISGNSIGVTIGLSIQL